MNAIYPDLKDKTILITGGGSGIGSSIVEHFCEQNSNVHFIDKNADDSNKLLTQIKSKKLKVPKFYDCDLTQINELEKIVSKVIRLLTVLLIFCELILFLLLLLLKFGLLSCLYLLLLCRQ